jgi:hypothetical protein
MVRPTSLSSTEPSSSIPSHSMDELDKTDAPPILEAYKYLFDVQCLVSLCDDPAGYPIPCYNTLTVQKPPARSPEPGRAPSPFDPSTLPEFKTPCMGVQIVRTMLNRVRCSRLSPSFSKSTFPTPYFVMSSARRRRSPARRGTLHCPRRQTHSSLRSQMPHSYNASSLCSTNPHGAAHARPHR